MNLFLLAITVACYSYAESVAICDKQGDQCRGNGRNGGHDTCCLINHENKKLECRTPDGGYGTPSWHDHTGKNGWCLPGDTQFPWTPPVYVPYCGQREASCSTRNGEVANCCEGFECLGKPHDQYCLIPGCKFYLEACEKDEDCCRRNDKCHPTKKKCGAQTTENCKNYKESCANGEECCRGMRCTGSGPLEKLCY